MERDSNDDSDFQEWLASALPTDLPSSATAGYFAAKPDTQQQSTCWPGNGAVWTPHNAAHLNSNSNQMSFTASAPPSGSMQVAAAAGEPCGGRAGAAPRPTCQQRANRMFHEKKKEQLDVLLAEMAEKRAEVAALLEVNCQLKRRAAALESTVAACDRYLALLSNPEPDWRQVAADSGSSPGDALESGGLVPTHHTAVVTTEAASWPSWEAAAPGPSPFAAAGAGYGGRECAAQQPLEPQLPQLQRTSSDDLVRLLSGPSQPRLAPIRSFSADCRAGQWQGLSTTAAEGAPAGLPSGTPSPLGPRVGSSTSSASAASFFGYRVTTEGSALIRASSTGSGCSSLSGFGQAAAGGGTAPTAPAHEAMQSFSSPASPFNQQPYQQQPTQLQLPARPWQGLAPVCRQGCREISREVGPFAWYKATMPRLPGLLQRLESAQAYNQPAAAAEAARDLEEAVDGLLDGLWKVSMRSRAACCSLLCTNMETGASAAPSDAHWRSVLTQISLGAEQRAQAMDCFTLYLQQVAAADCHKEEALQELQVLFEDPGHSTGYQEAARKLESILSADVAALAVLTYTLRGVLTPSQLARWCMCAWPFIPSPVDLLTALHRESASDLALVAGTRSKAFAPAQRIR